MSDSWDFDPKAIAQMPVQDGQTVTPVESILCGPITPSIRSAADLPLTTMFSALDWAHASGDMDRCEALVTAIYRELDRRFDAGAHT